MLPRGRGARLQPDGRSFGIASWPHQAHPDLTGALAERRDDVNRPAREGGRGAREGARLMLLLYMLVELTRTLLLSVAAYLLSGKGEAFDNSDVVCGAWHRGRQLPGADLSGAPRRKPCLPARGWQRSDGLALGVEQRFHVGGH